MKATKFQAKVQETLKQGDSVLLIAPTGIGKTFAVTGDLAGGFCKTIYGAPLRALGDGIRRELGGLTRGGRALEPRIHHGDLQESLLFSEEVVVTTYDQIVCAVPGLPLSLPLRAGHAVAGALLMSRLILDEVHLAWAISEQALAIMLGIMDLRRRFGLQTVVATATLPRRVAELLRDSLGLRLFVVGDDDFADDEGLELRERNREVLVSTLPLPALQSGSQRLDLQPLDELLRTSTGKRIYFANTVERLQETFDRLTAQGLAATKICVLHNRMPRRWRAAAEQLVHERFGKASACGDWILLTTQVAEAGLDISAPLVVSDPAPVDTLVQRAGRCARWFRSGFTKGTFVVITVPKDHRHEWSLPYREACVGATLKLLPDGTRLNWSTERNWVSGAWGLRLDSSRKLPKKPEEEQRKQIEGALSGAPFALNLFDRAAQHRRPGEIAAAFREIVSAEVAVEDPVAPRDLQQLVGEKRWPETCSVSLGQARRLLGESRNAARVLRLEDGEVQVSPADHVQPGDVLVIPSSVAYLHVRKGLCFTRGAEVPESSDVVLESDWSVDVVPNRTLAREGGRRQTLREHTLRVMEATYRRFAAEGAYRRALEKIVTALEDQSVERGLVDVIAQFATLAAALHDLGKADGRWQAKAREVDPDCPEGLVGRTLRPEVRLGVPHAAPGYLATVKACELLTGAPESSAHLIRSIALAGVRHHSSLFNPAAAAHEFLPHSEAHSFVSGLLHEVGVDAGVSDLAAAILGAAQQVPSRDIVPLLLPNDDLFPVYALVGRAILMADREDASGRELESWRESS